MAASPFRLYTLIAASAFALAVAMPAFAVDSPSPMADKPKAEVRTAYSASPPPAGTLPGAQPTVPAGSFDARWSAFR